MRLYARLLKQGFDIIPAQPELILPVRAESPLTQVADTRQPMLIAHPTNFLLPSSFFLTSVTSVTSVTESVAELPSS
jgi:hypothetical protein